MGISLSQYKKILYGGKKLFSYISRSAVGALESTYAMYRADWKLASHTHAIRFPILVGLRFACFVTDFASLFDVLLTTSLTHLNFWVQSLECMLCGWDGRDFSIAHSASLMTAR